MPQTNHRIFYAVHIKNLVGLQILRLFAGFAVHKVGRQNGELRRAEHGFHTRVLKIKFVVAQGTGGIAQGVHHQYAFDTFGVFSLHGAVGKIAGIQQNIREFFLFEKPGQRGKTAPAVFGIIKAVGIAGVINNRCFSLQRKREKQHCQYCKKQSLFHAQPPGEEYNLSYKKSRGKPIPRPVNQAANLLNGDILRNRSTMPGITFNTRAISSSVVCSERENRIDPCAN